MSTYESSGDICERRVNWLPISALTSMCMYVCLCFLDASKAFDRINHHLGLLFHKFHKRGLPTAVVRLLYSWYSNQTMCVKSCDHLSQPFHVTNGVRPGGILSLVLFNLYLEELRLFFYQVCINHIFYANDAVLMAPSPSALQTLVSICEDYGWSQSWDYL